MSQHLLAADRLADGFSSELLRQGYPLGPHAIVVSLEKGLGVSLVHGFTGLTIAVAVLAPLTALAAFPDRSRAHRVAAALVIGLPYLVASYFAQGAFKETMQALWVLAFMLALRETTRNPLWRDLELRFVPAAVIAIGAVYTYSFPGLIWLAAVLAAWLALERELPVRPLLLALAALAVGALPELGRMIEFHNFETFDPNGPGLGNLFGQISPLTALGIWFSGDFRVAAGDGAAPAIAYYLGAAFAAVLLALGLARCVRGRESAILGGVAAVVAPLPRRPDRRHPVHVGQGARGRGAGPDAGDRLALARGAWRFSGVYDGKSATGARFETLALPVYLLLAGLLLGPGPRQRPGRADHLLAGADRAAAADRRRLDPRPRPARAARGTARRPLHRLGAPRRPGLHRRRRPGAAGDPARGPVRDHLRRAHPGALSRHDPPQGGRSVSALGPEAGRSQGSRSNVP